jgi:hypothetical protein
MVYTIKSGATLLAWCHSKHNAERLLKMARKAYGWSNARIEPTDEPPPGEFYLKEFSYTRGKPTIAGWLLLAMALGWVALGVALWGC